MDETGLSLFVALCTLSICCDEFDIDELSLISP